MAIHDTGVIELRFQEVDTGLSWCNNMTGFSPGANNRDPGSTHLAFSLPISTGAESLPLRLSAPDQPLLGSTVRLEVSEIPSTALLSTTIVSFTRLRLRLDGLGMPGRFQHVGSDVGLGVAGGNPQASFSFGITNDPTFLGLPIRAQSLSLVPNVNPLGALASNGVELVLGNQ
ncbi:MAG: hypothetical protein NXI31_02785 [bacterium]|nr:hypothetical protein [bacterium]